MATAISQCSFSLTPHHGRAYELNINFSDSTGASLSTKHIQFTQDRAPVEARLWDVASINGRCGSPYFNWTDGHNIKASLPCYTAAGSTGPIIVTLDLKDSHNKYFCLESPVEELSSEEDAVCAFFQNPKVDDSKVTPATRIHGLFQKVHPVDFVLREGSLKKDLLQSGLFSDREVDFFQNSKFGEMGFCQTAEFFMNALKLGSVAKISGVDFPLDRYVTCVASARGSFGPYKTSTVLYPPLYKEMYSADGVFFRTLGSVFSIEGAYNPKSGITSINVAAKV